jgi:hypothetical protein
MVKLIGGGLGSGKEVIGRCNFDAMLPYMCMCICKMQVQIRFSCCSTVSSVQ